MICIQATLGEGIIANGGSEEDRTLYLLNANQALSQMSYRPISVRFDLQGMYYT